MRLWLQRGLLICIHLVYSVFLFVSGFWSYFKRRIVLTGDIAHFSRSVNKIPEHIVFVVNADEASGNSSLDQLCSLVHWSVMLGIKNISLYDNKCYFIKYLDIFEDKLSNKLKSNRRIKFRGSQQNGSIDHNVIYFTHYNSSVIRVLSMLDFKGTLSIAAKELIRRHLNDSGSEDDCKNDKPISPVDIDEFLIKKLGLPNPELAVICSPTPCLLGVLPWHMRLTEIVSLPSFGSLMPHDFIQVLNRYTMCQQRLGK